MTIPVLFGCSILLASRVDAQSPAKRVSSSHFPAACFFFAPPPEGRSSTPDATAKDRAYHSTLAEVYRLWCSPNSSHQEARSHAADAMAQTWKSFWDEDPPFNAEFHETGSFDLLALMGITHQLPEPMVQDPKFLAMWVEDCKNTCFTINTDLNDPKDQRYVIMQLKLRNDVLDHLRKEPAAEPVIKMLEDAQFRLVD